MADRSTKVLLIEDNPADARLIREILSEAKRSALSSIRGYTFDLEWAECLAAGLERLAAEGVDVVLLDLSLPDSQGLETFAKVHDRALHVPIILLTGLDDEELAVRTVQEGAQDYLVKGRVDSSLLARAIRYAIERKRAEEERKTLEEQLFQSQKMEAIGTLAAGIAHDFNNILTAMMGYAELLETHPGMPEFARLDLRRIMEGGQRAAHLIRQILDFSRKSIIQRQSLDMIAFLKETVRFLQRTIPENVDIVLEIEAGAYPVHAGLAQLQQMLTNLAVNARDAMPEGGELRFRLSRLVLKPDDRPLLAEMRPGEWVELSVSDTGTGISPEDLPQVFDPFYTTKKVGQGTGLGLAQVYGIVTQHEGFIDVDSEVGKGTTFIVYLPVRTSEEEEREEEPEEKLSDGHGETILVVEDDPFVMDLIEKMLNRLGYRVLTTGRGEDALTVYAEHREEIGLVLTDLVMPGMGGVELFHALRERDPEVKVVVITGYPLEDEGEELLARGIVAWMQKPVSLNKLRELTSRAFS